MQNIYCADTSTIIHAYAKTILCLPIFVNYHIQSILSCVNRLQTVQWLLVFFVLMHKFRKDNLAIFTYKRIVTLGMLIYNNNEKIYYMGTKNK